MTQNLLTTHLISFLVLLYCLFQTSCVSINLSKTVHKKSDKIEFQSPPSPFELFSVEHLDKAWRSSRNGNSISLLSECSTQSDETLRQIQNEVLGTFDSKEIVSSTFVQYNRRRALKTKVHADVDGVKSITELLIFKKNGCLYIISFVGLSQYFSDDQPIFQAFIEGFKAK